MKPVKKITLMLLVATALLFTACNKNVTGGGKTKFCGCPGQKGKGGW